MAKIIINAKQLTDNGYIYNRVTGNYEKDGYVVPICWTNIVIKAKQSEDGTWVTGYKGRIVLQREWFTVLDLSDNNVIKGIEIKPFKDMDQVHTFMKVFNG